MSQRILSPVEIGRGIANTFGMRPHATSPSTPPTRLSTALVLAWAWALLGTSGCDGGETFFPTVVERPAQSVRITEVRAYQTHERTLFVAEAEPAPEEDEVEAPPLLANRRTLIRAMVAPVDGEMPREITGRLRFRSSSGDDDVVLESKAFILTPSIDGNLASSLTWILEPEDVTPALTLKVALYETRIEVLSDEEDLVVDAPQARWPITGRSRLRPREAPRLRVRLVPLANPIPQTDEVGRIPEVTPALLERLQEKVLERFPVGEVQLEVATPLTLAEPVEAYGAGWQDAAAQLADVYPTANGVITFGLLAPTERRADFCPLNCVQGVTQIVETDSEGLPVFGSVALALAYDDDTTAETFVHELGHTLGRHHAPCDVDDDTVDPNYPHADGKIGSWGWNAKTESLRPPSDRDFMSYCSPTWVSPYQTHALLEALDALAAEPSVP